MVAPNHIYHKTKGNSMKRIYSNYSEEDYEFVEKMAKELGFSLSSFQHYCVMLYADKRGNTTTISRLKSDMKESLDVIKSGETFIVSALLPKVWPSLSRSTKSTLSIQLKNIVKNNTAYDVFRKVKGQTTVYIKN